MKRLFCPVCTHEVYFDSLQCVRCRTELAMAVEPDGAVRVADVATVRPCERRPTWACNWRAADIASGARWCTSCVRVDAGDHAGDARMVPFQAAQRRALLQLARLGVPWEASNHLGFTYRSTAAGDAATIGHRGGEITLDLDEADFARQEEIRSTLGELYRTPLGHIRHELGHVVWLELVAPDAARLAEFRARFGDETVDYAGSLERHYGHVDDGGWRGEYVSFYASAHPWEDFAESWAQVMHVHDVVETGAEWGVVAAPLDEHDADSWLSASITASLAANELARAMGMRDLYPFTLSPGVRAKIEFCWGLINP